MTFDEVLAQVQALLQQEKRLSYRGLKRRFALDDEYIEDLKEELIGAKQIATDEDGRFLVWSGNAEEDKGEGITDKGRSGESGGETAKGGNGEKAVAISQRAAAERRQLTVMFCDLVDSTALSARLDPEELREVVGGYQQVSAEIIERYGGYIAQYLGDGLLVYFGYPVAHEDDAARAVRAGLEITTAIAQHVSAPLVGVGQDEGAEGKPLQVRIGIHTGLVVVGEIGGGTKRELLALGETPNLAARVQGVAEPDTVVISAVTQRLVHGLFACQDLGQQTLKGISTPLSLYRVIGESVAHSRFEVAVGTGLTPLVGREEELGVLQRRWAQAKDGAGQVVLLSGEPGIGKSRLVQELKEYVSAAGATRIEFRCSPYHQNSALYPIIDHLQRFLQFAREDTPATKLEKLQHTLSHYRFPQADTLPFLAALLSLPHPVGYPPITVSPQKQKEKTHAALVAWLVEDTEHAAVFCAWEDLHWADPSTVEVLTLLLDQVPTTRLLALLTFRPEFTPLWKSRSHISHFTLSRLGRSQVETMVEQVIGSKTLPKEVVQQIVSKTDGVPLFVEELTKSVVESVGTHGHTSLQSFDIPATLHDSLMARLDRLGSAKDIAQLGATIGREFSYELLFAVSSIDEEELQHRLKQLIDAELVYQRGIPPQATYLFKHALIQDTAYQSLLKSTRQQYHKQIARVLEERFPETQANQPELFAHHYTEAGQIEQAIPYWQQAGQRASRCSANEEATSHLHRALDLLHTLPDTAVRTQQELSLQIAYGSASMAAKGYCVPEVEKAYTRARTLCQQLGETPQLFPILVGLTRFYSARAELQIAQELAEQCMTLAKRTQDTSLLVESHRALGNNLYFLGEFTAARVHLEQVIVLYEPQQDHSVAVFYVVDPAVSALSYNAWTLWMLGYPDQALKRNQELIALAQTLAHDFSLGLALVFSAALYQFCQELNMTQERAERGIRLATERGFITSPLAWGKIFRGWVLSEQGQREEGITEIRQGMAAWRSTGAEVGRTHFLALLAEACGKAGQLEDGLAILVEALEVVSKTSECFYEAELYRLKGELTLQKSGAQSSKSKIEEEAKECFLRAIDISRQQQAKSLELRATVSLAKLWQRQGKRAEAHRMLADIYGWFTEGFDTKDLQEAKTLLDELSD